MMKNFVQKLTGLDSKAIPLRFVLMFGVISLFADFTYEGSRSIVGPYLAQLGASGTAVGIIAGLGELLGYGLRLVSGRCRPRRNGPVLAASALRAQGTRPRMREHHRRLPQGTAWRREVSRFDR
jgi:hypothetical protein